MYYKIKGINIKLTKDPFVEYGWLVNLAGLTACETINLHHAKSCLFFFKLRKGLIAAMIQYLTSNNISMYTCTCSLGIQNWVVKPKFLFVYEYTSYKSLSY